MSRFLVFTSGFTGKITAAPSSWTATQFADQTVSRPVVQLRCIQMPTAKFMSSSSVYTKATMTASGSLQNGNGDASGGGSRLLKLARTFNNFYFNGINGSEYKPLYCQGHHIGLVSRDVEKELLPYPSVFVISADKIDLCPGVSGYDEISAQVDCALRSLRDKNIFTALKGWRNETYDIRCEYGQPPLFTMERAATCMFGLRQYGVDVNGYVVGDDGEISLWMQRRSKTKPTWPGRIDNFVAGGLSRGFSVTETVIKETQEEANLPAEIAEQVKPAGCVSFFFQSERGIFPQTEFVFDIELPKDFVPSNNDGEVEEFILVPGKELIDKICDPEMKTTSCPVLLDFLIRKGLLSLESEPDLPELIELLHIPVHSLYKKNAAR